MVLFLTRTLQAEEQSGFVNALLDILQAEQNNAIRLSGQSAIGAWIKKGY